MLLVLAVPVQGGWGWASQGSPDPPGPQTLPGQNQLKFWGEDTGKNVCVYC